MKLIVKFLAIILILNLIGCSFRRLKRTKRTKPPGPKQYTKEQGFPNSHLEYMTKIIAGRMCSRFGKTFTYAFFANMDNYLSGSLKDSKVYDAIWGTTFTNNQHLNINTISRDMLYTTQVALGGTWEEKPQKYWDLYVNKIANENAAYLRGLVAATKGESPMAAMNPRPEPKLGLFQKTY